MRSWLVRAERTASWGNSDIGVSLGNPREVRCPKLNRSTDMKEGEEDPPFHVRGDRRLELDATTRHRPGNALPDGSTT